MLCNFLSNANACIFSRPKITSFADVLIFSVIFLFFSNFFFFFWVRNLFFSKCSFSFFLRNVQKKICVAGGDRTVVESPTEPKWSPEGIFEEVISFTSDFLTE